MSDDDVPPVPLVRVRGRAEQQPTGTVGAFIFDGTALSLTWPTRPQWGGEVPHNPRPHPNPLAHLAHPVPVGRRDPP